MSKTLKAFIAIPRGYRLLKTGEKILATDLVYEEGDWMGIGPFALSKDRSQVGKWARVDEVTEVGDRVNKVDASPIIRRIK